MHEALQRASEWMERHHRDVRRLLWNKFRRRQDPEEHVANAMGLVWIAALRDAESGVLGQHPWQLVVWFAVRNHLQGRQAAKYREKRQPYDCFQTGERVEVENDDFDNLRVRSRYANPFQWTRQKLDYPALLRAAGLSDRQLEIFGLFRAGYTQAEIAEKLGLSNPTVMHHRLRIADAIREYAAG